MVMAGKYCMPSCLRMIPGIVPQHCDQIEVFEHNRASDELAMVTYISILLKIALQSIVTRHRACDSLDDDSCLQQ